MRSAAVLFVLIASVTVGSGLEGYTVPGIETDQVLISIHVWGEVRDPGTHLVPVEADLIAGISAAGGPTGEADLNDVRIVYDNLEIRYDLDRFLDARGEAVPSLMPGATIYIPTRSYVWWKDVVDFSYKIIIAVNLIWLIIER